MKRTIKTKEKPATQPKLTKSQEIELLAIRMFEKDKAKALKVIDPARKKIEAWKAKAHKELVAKLASATPSEIIFRGYRENQEAVVEALASIPVPKEIRDAQNTLDSHASLAIGSSKGSDDKSLSDWGYLCHTYKYTAENYRKAAKQKYQQIQTEGLVKLVADSRISDFIDSVIEGKSPTVQFQIEG